MVGDRYLFGPVPSRRLGRSLGVDLIPFKTCTLNCIYCQLGRTLSPSIERKAYVPVDEVLKELADWQVRGGVADVITLAGSGEPTLHTEFGCVLDYAREVLHLPSVLLTNGTLLYLDEVCRQAMRADIVKVTLSAWDAASFTALHRPHPSLSFQQFFEGEKMFSRLFHGTLWVEVFLVEGVNTHPKSLRELSRLAQELHPDRIHINTAVRPAAEGNVIPVSRETLQMAAELLGSGAEIVAAHPSLDQVGGTATVETVYALIERHPSSARDIADAFGATAADVQTCLNELLRHRRIKKICRAGLDYYALPGLDGK